MWNNSLVKQYSSLVGDEDGFPYRDLNKNGRLDVYEDPRQPTEARVEDLLGQMTLEEKAGLFFMNGVQVNPDGSLDEDPEGIGFGGVARDLVAELKIEPLQSLANPRRPGVGELAQ